MTKNGGVSMTLTEFFDRHPKAAMGFSGGVDSSYLRYAAAQCGADVRPYFTKVLPAHRR